MYYVIELKSTNTSGQAEPIHVAGTKDEAMGVFYQILAAAAVSDVKYHTCMVVDERGQYLDRKSFTH